MSFTAALFRLPRLRGTFRPDYFLQKAAKRNDPPSS
jgi:hypothetical protein